MIIAMLRLTARGCDEERGREKEGKGGMEDFNKQ